MTRATKWLDCSLLALSVLFGVGSVALLAWEGRPTFVPMNWPVSGALAWDALLSFLFFLQHSGMVRRSFRARLAAIVPPRYDGAVYAIASGIALALVVVLWQPTGLHLLVLDGILRWAATACSALAIAIFAWSGYALRMFDPLGLRPIWAHVHDRPVRTAPFVARGPYRCVRHPLYSCVLVLFWCNPDLTADRLLLDVLWTAWIYVGAVLEERDLVADFGEVYREYQRRVPMLVPWRGPVPFETKQVAGVAGPGGL